MFISTESTNKKEERVFWRNMIDDNQVKLDSYVPDPSKKRKMEGEYASEFSLEVSFIVV